MRYTNRRILYEAISSTVFQILSLIFQKLEVTVTMTTPLSGTVCLS